MNIYFLKLIFIFEQMREKIRDMEDFVVAIIRIAKHVVGNMKNFNLDKNLNVQN
jgi:hypothetical protein